MLRPHLTSFFLILTELFNKACIVYASNNSSYLHKYFQISQIKIIIMKSQYVLDHCDIDKNMRLKESLGL